MRELEKAAEQARGAAPGSHEERQRMALESQIAQLYNLNARQERAIAESQRATHRTREAVREGRYAAIRLRALIRSILGPRDPRLTAFGIAPLRRRRRWAR
jgi:hypothetical protein